MRLAWILAGAVAARAAMRAAEQSFPASGTDGVPSLLERTNFRGEKVTLAEGVGAVAAHCLAGAGLAGLKGAAAFAITGAVGLADDVLEPLLYRDKAGPPKGFKGHLGSLMQGTLTTGNIKILGITACSGTLALLISRTRSRRAPLTRMAEAALDTLLIAASANLANLFDLRPGRAMKTVSAAHLLISGATVLRNRGGTEGESDGIIRFTSAHVGAMAALAADDLAARSMLGDAGANVLGAAVGTRAATLFGTRARVAATIVVLALTFASEKISFSHVIATTPALRAVDEWGRV